MDAAGARRRARETASADVLDFVEPEGASRSGSFYDRRRPLRKSRSGTQRRLLDVSRGARTGRAGSGLSERVEIPAPGRWQHADHHGRPGHGCGAVSRIFAGSTIDRRERKELALLRLTAQTLQLFLRKGVR